MMLADTSIWIEFLKGNAKYSRILADFIEQRTVHMLECVFAELLQGVRNEREAKVIQEYWHQLPQISDSGIWIAAGYLSFRERFLSKGIGIVDAAILVAAKKHKLKIWTLDKKLQRAVSSSALFNASF